MTKFEEEAIKEAEKCGYVMAKSKIVFYEDEKGITFVDFNGTHTNFNFPWLEFAKNWHSDEEFQELKEQHGNQAESILLMLEEIDSLKSQLQQQVLPVVPEFFGKWIDSDSLAELITRWYCHTDALPKNILEYLENFQDEKANDGYDWEQSNEAVVQLIIHSKVTGYQVEKPQLFYLKDELTGQFLAKDNRLKDEDRYFFWTGADPLTHSIGRAWKLTFTQQEIDSMQTGSYEQIEVAE